MTTSIYMLIALIIASGSCQEPRFITRRMASLELCDVPKGLIKAVSVRAVHRPQNPICAWPAVRAPLAPPLPGGVPLHRLSRGRKPHVNRSKDACLRFQ